MPRLHPPPPLREHPVFTRFREKRAGSAQLRIADLITSFAGSMPFVYVHVGVFAGWMLFVEKSPWPTLTLVVSLEAIFLSTFVLIGQNRASAFQQEKADHDFLDMDLGLDRGDVLTALDAFGVAEERRIDLGQVNGRVFVNNVSLGLYAQIVRSPEYREAKMDTTLSMLPGMLGPGSHPFDLRFTGPDGEQYARAHVVQVSNNAYGSTPATLANRPRLDGGHLGVIALKLPDDPAEARRQLAAARGHAESSPGSIAWEPSTFEVDSDEPIDVGLDGGGAPHRVPAEVRHPARRAAHPPPPEKDVACTPVPKDFRP